MDRPPAAAQCEPVDLEPIDVERSAPLPPRPISRRVWTAVGVVTVVAWGAIAFATHDASHDTAPRAPIDALAAGVVDLGTGRFAAVVDDQLAVIARDRPGLHTLVPLGPGPIAVTAQSGDSLLVQTRDGAALVFTAPVHSEIVPEAQRLIPSAVSGQWWMQRSDDALTRLNQPVEVLLGPVGRVVAAVGTGFIATSSGQELRWVSKDYHRELGYGTFLASSGSFIAVRSQCLKGSCAVIVRDLSMSVVVGVIPMFDTVIAAAIEPTGEHIALETATGETVLYDLNVHRIVARFASQLVAQPGAPFAWLPTGEQLLVALPDRVVVANAYDGEVERTIPVRGVHQIFALP